MRDRRGKSETAGPPEAARSWRDRGPEPGLLGAWCLSPPRRRLRRPSPPPVAQPDGALDRLHDLEVERVAAVACDDVGADRTAEQRQIPEQVENLVAHELVAEAKAVQRAAVAEHDRVVERAAAREAVLRIIPRSRRKPYVRAGANSSTNDRSVGDQERTWVPIAGWSLSRV